MIKISITGFLQQLGRNSDYQLAGIRPRLWSQAGRIAAKLQSRRIAARQAAHTVARRIKGRILKLSRSGGLVWRYLAGRFPGEEFVNSRLRFWKCRSKSEYQSYLALPFSEERYRFEFHLAERHQSSEPFAVPGYCLVCQTPSDFVADLRGGIRTESGIVLPNWRESLQCQRCGLNNRQRLVSYLATAKLEGAGTRCSCYITEQITPLYRSILGRFGGDRVVGSEFLGSGREPGSMVDGIRHEDVQRLSFRDSQFNLMLSFEVFEHIPDPDRALSEAHRVLRPGGELILTVPFFMGYQVSVRRAALRNGSLEHLLPAVYHGNPMVPEKESLVFTDFGWDLLARMRAAGFENSFVSFWWSYEYGHLDVNSCIFHAFKSSKN